MPQKGFSVVFQNLLTHPNINIELNSDASKRIKINEENILFDEQIWEKPILYTGSIDELLNYEFGELPYRSIDMEFEFHKLNNYQPLAVVNYPNEEKFTRITEFKYLTGQVLKNKTTILKEYPKECKRSGNNYDIPYYPIINDSNIALYSKYRKVLSKFKNFYVCGRLGEYKYYNMDTAIEQAFLFAENF